MLPPRRERVAPDMISIYNMNRQAYTWHRLDEAVEAVGKIVKNGQSVRRINMILRAE